MFEIDFHWESFQMTTTPLLGLIRLHNSQKFDLCTFSKWCLTLFEFDRVPAKCAHLVPKFAMFELVFHSKSSEMPQTSLLGLVILHYSQKFDPYTFLGWCVRPFVFDKSQEKTVLVHNFVTFEVGFHSQGLKTPTTLSLDPFKLRYCQKTDPCTFLRWYVRVFEIERLLERMQFQYTICYVWDWIQLRKLWNDYNDTFGSN